MAWYEETVDVEQVSLALNGISAGTWIGWAGGTGSVDPDSLFIDVFGVPDGDSVRYKAYLLFDFTSGAPDAGWSQEIAAYGDVAAEMGGVTLSTLTRETYGVRRGSSFQRRMLLVWK